MLSCIAQTMPHLSIQPVGKKKEEVEIQVAEEVCLGEGGFGRVVKVGDRVFKKSTTAESLREEYNIMLQVRSHPNVLKVIRLSPCGKEMEMEYGGVDLYELMSLCKDNGTTMDVRNIYHQVLSGVSHIHSKNVAHMDLKLENMLLNDEGKLKIIDYGLARYFTPGTARVCTDRQGSLSYVAPEVMVRSPMYDPFLSDLWSMGVVCFSLATFGFPFPQATSNCTIFSTFKSELWNESPSSALKKMWGRSFRVKRVTDPYVWQQVDMTLQVDPSLRVPV
jgi:serine/threonine protein kinase